MALEALDVSVNRAWLYQPTFPEHWTPCALHSMARWVNGIAFKNIQFTPTGRPVIKIAEIKGGLSGQTKFTRQTFDDSVRVRSGDLLFSWSGQPETSIDAFWWRGPEGWLNQHVFRVTPEDGIDAVFFYYLLRYLKPNFIGIARNKQTTGLGHVTKRDLENLEVAYPEPREQRAIGHILGTLDDKIEQNRQMSATLEAMARALFTAWFVDFEPVRAKADGYEPDLPPNLAALFPDRLLETEYGLVPEGWQFFPLPKLFEINPTRSLKKNALAPYVGMANLPTSGHTPYEVVERQFGSGTRFMQGDTLVARITPCLENGKTAFVDFLQDAQIGWGSTEYIVLRPKPPWPEEAGYLLARDQRFREFAIQGMTGSSGRQRVPASALDHFLFVSPTPEILPEFGSAVKPWFARSSAAVREARTLAALRDALLPKLISGELRVRDAETFLERVL